MTSSKTTHCPNCGIEIDVNELLYHQLDEQARQKYQQQLALEQSSLSKQRAEIESKGQDIQKAIDQQVTQKLAEQSADLQKKYRQEIELEQAERIKSMQNELAEKSKQVIQLNSAQTEIEKLKREKQALRSEIELDVEKNLPSNLLPKRARFNNKFRNKRILKLLKKNRSSINYANN